MALTVILALGGSLVLALNVDASSLLIPAAGPYRGTRQRDHPRLLKSIYSPILRLSLGGMAG